MHPFKSKPLALLVLAGGAVYCAQSRAVETPVKVPMQPAAYVAAHAQATRVAAPAAKPVRNVAQASNKRVPMRVRGEVECACVAAPVKDTLFNAREQV